MLRFNKDLWDAREVDIVLKRAASAVSHSSALLTPVATAAVLGQGALLSIVNLAYNIFLLSYARELF